MYIISNNTLHKDFSIPTVYKSHMGKNHHYKPVHSHVYLNVNILPLLLFLTCLSTALSKG